MTEIECERRPNIEVKKSIQLKERYTSVPASLIERLKNQEHASLR